MSFVEESGRLAGWGVDKFDMFGSWGVLGSLLENRRGRPRRGGSAAGVVGVMKAGLRRWMEMVSSRDPIWSVK